MNERPYETPAFQNAAEYTVTLTFVIAGGKRRGTAQRRGERVAERLTNYAARLADVVDLVATGGLSHKGEVTMPRRVHFAAANTARGQPDVSGKLDRYVDPERDRALRALAADNAAAKARAEADRQRRSALGCRNVYRPLLTGKQHCDCVYCRPADHLMDIRGLERGDAAGLRFVTPRCLCGHRVALPGQRCTLHRDTRLVVLDGDPPELHLLADYVSTA